MNGRFHHKNLPEWIIAQFSKGVLMGLGIFASVLVAITVSGTVNSFESGDLVSAERINQNFASLKSTIESLPECSEYSVQLTNSSSQNVSNGIIQAFSWDTEVFDTQNMHETGSPTRITISNAGRYLIHGRVSFSTNSSNNRTIYIYKNGTKWSTNDYAAAPSTVTKIDITEVMNLSVGDYIELSASQDSGSSLSSDSAVDRFSVFRLCSN